MEPTTGIRARRAASLDAAPTPEPAAPEPAAPASPAPATVPLWTPPAPQALPTPPSAPVDLDALAEKVAALLAPVILAELETTRAELDAREVTSLDTQMRAQRDAADVARSLGEGARDMLRAAALLKGNAALRQAAALRWREAAALTVGALAVGLLLGHLGALGALVAWVASAATSRP